jgi:hypothetical protein
MIVTIHRFSHHFVAAVICVVVLSLTFLILIHKVGFLFILYLRKKNQTASFFISLYAFALP